MKMTDGLFHKTFDEIAKEYPQIQTDHYIIDIGCARLASKPEIFDVIVTMNLYGDIISDIAAEISGSVGLAGSANIGDDYAMFEAIHGSAPLMAGKQSANPSAFLNGAILMLKHMGMNKKAELIENALFKTIEDGFHTKDIFVENKSKKKLGTMEFAQEIIERFGEKCSILNQKNNSENQSSGHMKEFDQSLYKDFLFEENLKKELVGFDFFIDLRGVSISKLGSEISDLIQNSKFKNQIYLSSIMYKGLKVWPKQEDDSLISDFNEIYDYWMLRFSFYDSFVQNSISENSLIINDFYKELVLKKIFDIFKIENLYRFISNDQTKKSFQGFSSGQGE
jgi:isocitrate dehydrogenase